MTNDHAMSDKQTHAPESPAGFRPFVVKGFYSKEMIELLQLQISLLKNDPSIQIDDEIFKRKEAHNHSLFSALHFLMRERIENLLDRNLKNTYTFASMYFEGAGECPKHVDRPQCKYTVDLCIGQKQVWPFFAEFGGEKLEFHLEPGDALILSGTDHPHWREKIQDGNFCDLAFFHFVDRNFNGGLD